MIIIIVIIFIIFVISGIFLYINKNSKKEKIDNSDILSQERINLIKNKYKAIENIRRQKKITKEDVEAFYRSQIDK